MLTSIKVQVFQAVLIVEGKRVRLTKSVAKQLPILDGGKRWRAAEKGEPQPEPICKVMGKTLGDDHYWLYLVTDPVAGLGWVAATEVGEQYAQQIIERGGWVDVPADVPTVIL